MISRRYIVASAAGLPFFGGLARSTRAEILDKGSRDVLKYQQTLSVPETVWRYALSFDAKSIAMVGSNTANVYVINLSTEAVVEIAAPDIRPKNLIVWSRDSQKLATSDGFTLIIASVEEARTIQQVNRIVSFGGFGEAAVFSRDGSKIYVQSTKTGWGYLLVSVDMASGEISPFMPTPVPDAQAVMINGGLFQCFDDGDVFDCIVGRWDGRKGKYGNREFDFWAYVIPLDQSKGPTPISFNFDFVRGIDGSGIMRQFVDKCLFSKPTGLTVAFRPSGTPLANVPVDVSKDKAFEAYDRNAHRVSTFGGYGVLEQNNINDFDLHPTRPLAITTAIHVSLDNGREAGMLTVWNLNDGQPLQRITTSVGVGKPRISMDGRLLSTTGARGIDIYRFV
jgi:hypothetical protein